MKEELEQLLEQVKAMRSRAFNERNEKVHQELGRAMSSLIRAREAL